MQRFPECSAVTLYIFDTSAQITGTFLLEEAPLGFDSSSSEFSSLVVRFVQQETTLVTTSHKHSLSNHGQSDFLRIFIFRRGARLLRRLSMVES